jgi:hypothetical protein
MPSLKQVREILNQTKFNPKDPGPLNVVAHSSGPSYLESRTMEFIMEAQINRIKLRDFKESEQQIESEKFYKKRLIRGIQCLVLAIIKVENGEF